MVEVEDIVIAIDPGRDKCGVAVVHRTCGVLQRQVVKTSELMPRAAELIAQYAIGKVIMGGSTYSGQLQQQLAGLQAIEIILIDEFRSTDEARQRYWQANPPRGIRRFIPVTMQVPPVPVDDYAAAILAERYFTGETSPKLTKN